MNKTWTRAIWTAVLLSAASGVSAQAPAAAGGAGRATPIQEPAGFVAGAAVGALAAGPVGAVIGAGIGTWLGNRVRKAGEAVTAEAAAASLSGEKFALSEANRALAARLEQMSRTVQAPPESAEDAARMLDGLQGDVLFRTGSHEIAPDTAREIDVLARAVAVSSQLKIRIDGYADPRGSEDVNLDLSQARADAVRERLLAGGVREEAIEVNAYGKTQSVAIDADGYALERRARLTLRFGTDRLEADGRGVSDADER